MHRTLEIAMFTTQNHGNCDKFNYKVLLNK